MRIWDISPVVSPGIAVWPGDVPFSRQIQLSLAAGDNLDLSSMTTTLHLGAHTDAPSHYLAGGPGIAERPLDLYLGPCQVMRVGIGRGERILPEHLPSEITASRLLLATGTYPDPDVFNDDFASLSPELVDHCAERGVRLLGIDTPSIDLCYDKVLLSHSAVARHDMAVLEGIVLEDVDPGSYMLIALPLRIEGADASPVRAVLFREEGG